MAGYKFVALTELESLQALLQAECSQLALKGTILLSGEGINVSLAGLPENITAFKTYLQANETLSDLKFHETYSSAQPFRTLKVKIKDEIITLRQPAVNPDTQRAPHVSPEEFKQWLDENREMTVLDTRNDYEVRFGTFKNAVNLHIDNFGEFPAAAEQLDRDKPIVMFCTGGIRCEKAAFYLLSQGFAEVRQLDGGILGYFAKVGGAHYEGECFVFDERVSVNAELNPTGTVQCQVCQGPIVVADMTTCPRCC